MVARIITSILLVALITFRCTEDDDLKEVTIEQDETEIDTVDKEPDPFFQHCDSVYIATFHGTACCVSGPIVAKPGDIARYHYQMNHRDAEVDWLIFEGDISIIAGQGTRTVTVKFGADFMEGTIIGTGVGIKYENLPQLCEDKVNVSQY